MEHGFPHLHVLLLADDYGEQLWPLARAQAPACLAPEGPGSQSSLLAAAVARTRPFTAEALHVATSAQLADVVAAELAAIGGLGASGVAAAGGAEEAAGGADLIAVPVAHGSAFSLALACACIHRQDPSAVVLVAPANQSMQVDDRWGNLVFRAYQVALRDRIAVFGSTQEERAAGVGYLRLGRQFENIDGSFNVRHFFADASLPAARRAVREGALWYTGMFMARAAVLLGAFGGAGMQAADEEALLGAARIAETATFFSLLERSVWQRPEAESVIRALPEASVEEVALAHSERLVALPLTVQVFALTSLDDIDATMEPDAQGNRGYGQALHVASRDVTVYEQEPGRLVCSCGLEDVLVVDTADVVLIADKRSLRNMQPLRDALQQAGAPQLEAGARRSFAWGSAQLLTCGERSASWLLRLRPGALLQPFAVPVAYGLPAVGGGAAGGSEPPAAGGGLTGRGAAGGDEPPALRVQCVVTSGVVMAEGTVQGTDVAAAGDAFELAEAYEPTLLCDDEAPAELVLTATLA